MKLRFGVTKVRLYGLIRPKWLVGHLVILILVALMVALGLWQLDRRDDRQAQNDDVAAVATRPPVAIDHVDDLNGLADYQAVEITGTADGSGTTYVRYPLRNGRQGYEVLVPVRVGGGSVVVNTGWISVDDGVDRARPDFSAQVIQTWSGQLRPSQESRGEVGSNNGQPPIPTVESVSIDQLSEAAGATAGVEHWVAVVDPQPTENAGLSAEGALLPLEKPTLDSGPHFSYALQWFSFGAIALVGWILLCRRAASDAGRNGPEPLQ